MRPGGLRSVGAALIGTAGLIVFALTVFRHDAPGPWYVWRLLAAIAQAGLFCLAALSGGRRLLRALGVRALPWRERLLTSFALGVLALTLLVVGVGLCGLLSRVTFFLIPVLFGGAGVTGLVREASRALRLKKRLARAPASLWTHLAWGAGTLAVVAVWLPLLTPKNIGYDAAWYHLPLAEQYAAVGAVFRLDEGFFNGAMPHLASYLYTWAFLTPFGTFADGLLLAAHLEFALFVATLLALPLLVDRLVPRPRVRASWVGFFLFPGVVLYDSSLILGADHVLAFWAAPLFLALLGFRRSPNWRSGALLGAMAGAAALTKYQAALLLAPVAVIIATTAVRARSRAVLLATAAVVCASLVVTAPHWLLNSLWHRNPLYPNLSSVFPSTPLQSGIDLSLTDSGFVASGTPAEKLWAALKATATFGFEAHDWETFHGARPVFGSLLLVALALAVFVPRRALVALLGASVLAGVPVWFLTQHQDRYLQALTPWAAAVVIAVFAGLWRQALVLRAVVLALSALQLVHTGDLWALPSHAMAGGNPLRAVLDLVSSTRPDEPERQLEQQFAFVKARAHLPADASVLVHDLHLHLGLGRRAVRDNIRRQGAINWAFEGSMVNVAALLNRLRISHLAYAERPLGFSGPGDDLVFYRVAQLAGRRVLSLGDGSVIDRLELERLRSDRPEALVVACVLAKLTPVELNMRWGALAADPCTVTVAPAEVDEQLAHAEVVVFDRRKHPQPPARLSAEFQLLFERTGLEVYGRR